MNYLKEIITVYLVIGFCWSVYTLPSSINKTLEKYPVINQTGHTKFQKFMFTVVKLNAFGFTAIFHILIMSVLYPLDIILERGKR